MKPEKVINLPKENARIEKLVKYFCGGKKNVSAFITKLEGVSHQSLNRLFNIDNRTGDYPGVSSDIISAISKGYPEVNPSWLLTGEGSMLKGQPQSEKADDPPLVIDVVPKLSDYINNLKHQAEYFMRITEVNLMSLGAAQKNLENLIKINLEHTGNVEAFQKGVKPEVVHGEINRDIYETVIPRKGS